MKEKRDKAIIGIVSKPNVFCDEELFTQQIVYDGVRNAVLKNDGIVIGILPTQVTNKFYGKGDITDATELSYQELQDLYQLVNVCDGIILQGGLASASYEIEVAKYAIEKDIPLLGICAGFNNMIRAMGGTVFTVQDDKIHNQEDGRLAHKNFIQKGSLLDSILQKQEIMVNSIHTMFALKENVKGLEIAAYSEDGYVEAVERKENRFVLGLKWHPEWMLDDEEMNKVLEAFVKVAKES